MEAAAGAAASTTAASAAPASGDSGGACLGTKCSVYSIRIAAGLPSTSAGVNRYCITASCADSSKPCPTGFVTVTLVTFPSTSMSTSIDTSADTRASSAPAGYTGSTARLIVGAFVSLGAGLGASGGRWNGAPRSCARAMPEVKAITTAAPTRKATRARMLSVVRYHSRGMKRYDRFVDFYEASGDEGRAARKDPVVSGQSPVGPLKATPSRGRR